MYSITAKKIQNVELSIIVGIFDIELMASMRTLWSDKHKRKEKP